MITRSHGKLSRANKRRSTLMPDELEIPEINLEELISKNPEEWAQFEECLNDQWWRLNNLYKIKDRNGSVVTFKPNEGQAELYHQHWYKNIILKARQRGYTTFICILALDYCLFNENFTAGINAHNLEDAKSFFEDKVKFAYDNMPEYVKKFRPSNRDASKEMSFSNGSRIRVGTSLRSGTYQFVHISEFGKLCAKYPQKAREIVSGTLNAVGKNQIVFIESTAEGKGGYFYDMVQSARTIKRMGEKLTRLDYKFFFSPWWQDPEYQLDPEGVTIPQTMQNYFTELDRKHGIVTTERQRAWYTKKKAEQKQDMRREYPSTEDEAFEAEIQGAYYKNEMRNAEEQGRVGVVPYDVRYPVHTVWDIGGAGGGDYTAIWFFQVIGGQIRCIDFWQGNGYSMVQIIKQTIEGKINDYRYRYGMHFGPHDIEVTDYSAFDPETYEPLTRLQIAAQHGLQFTPLARLPISDGIEAARDVFPMTYFDKAMCERGIQALREFQQAWDNTNAVFRDVALKNWAIHAADAFRYLATAFKLYFSHQAMKEPMSIEDFEERLAEEGI